MIFQIFMENCQTTIFPMTFLIARKSMYQIALHPSKETMNS